jgi:hypothetical protein
MIGGTPSVRTWLRTNWVSPSCVSSFVSSIASTLTLPHLFQFVDVGVIDVNTCEPMEGVLVDIWQCVLSFFPSFLFPSTELNVSSALPVVRTPPVTTLVCAICSRPSTPLSILTLFSPPFQGTPSKKKSSNGKDPLTKVPARVSSASTLAQSLKRRSFALPGRRTRTASPSSPRSSPATTPVARLTSTARSSLSGSLTRTGRTLASR